MDRSLHTPPLLTGRPVTLRELEREFGPCPGMVLGYGEGEFGPDGKLRWCAAALPRDAMVRFVNGRHRQGIYGSFLIAMGSLKRAASRGGIGEALYGFGLASDVSLPASQLLWPDQLNRPDALNGDGEFRWRIGVPFLRVWLCEAPKPIVELTGVQPAFQRHHGIRVVPLEEVAAGLSEAVKNIPLRSAVLDRPHELPEIITQEVKVTEGNLKYTLTGVRERDRAIVSDALDRNRIRYGEYTCEDCAYQPATDFRVPRRFLRGMLDVHHIELLARGERITRVNDLLVLCPRCHRRQHVIQQSEDLAAREHSIAGPV